MEKKTETQRAVPEGTAEREMGRRGRGRKKKRREKYFFFTKSKRDVAKEAA